jgi:hypothetical protein
VLHVAGTGRPIVDARAAGRQGGPVADRVRQVDHVGVLGHVEETGGVWTVRPVGDALPGHQHAFKTREEEIDLLLANDLADPFWTGLSSPIIMVECKNWKESNKPGVAELRVLESKMADRRSICKIGIFISMSGFSDTFMTRLKAIQSDGGMIFAVSGDDLFKIVTDKIKLSDWLKIDGLRQSLRGERRQVRQGGSAERGAVCRPSSWRSPCLGQGTPRAGGH